jgi:hypothetical protein
VAGVELQERWGTTGDDNHPTPGESDGNKLSTMKQCHSDASKCQRGDVNL